VSAPHPEYSEWGPWYRAFDAAPAGETDPAFAGTGHDGAVLGGGQGDSGGGFDPYLVNASFGSGPYYNNGDVIVPA